MVLWWTAIELKYTCCIVLSCLWRTSHSSWVSSSQQLETKINLKNPENGYIAAAPFHEWWICFVKHSGPKKGGPFLSWPPGVSNPFLVSLVWNSHGENSFKGSQDHPKMSLERGCFPGWQCEMFSMEKADDGGLNGREFRPKSGIDACSVGWLKCSLNLLRPFEYIRIIAWDLKQPLHLHGPYIINIALTVFFLALNQIEELLTHNKALLIILDELSREIPGWGPFCKNQKDHISQGQQAPSTGDV